MATKTVCIVGAGPSGHVAAKTLLNNAPAGSKFQVTILEAQHSFGGLWPLSKTDNDRLVHPLMVANQSRHTVQFSDYPPTGLPEGCHLPQMPLAWQVGEYIKGYRAAYLSHHEESGALTYKFESRVEKAEPVKGSNGDAWRVRFREAGKEITEQTFDYLLVAGGFFGKPYIPPELRRDDDVPVVHSSQYCTLKQLLGNARQGEGGKILIVGGQMSGIEIAGTIATHLSTAVNSPEPSPIPSPEKYSIHHLVQRPTWVYPTYTSPAPTLEAPPFLPLDLPAYNVAPRSKPFENTQGYITEDIAKAFHSIMHKALGTDQSEFSSAVAVKEDTMSDPPFIAVSDCYLEFVRSGLISVSKGKLGSLSGTAATVAGSGVTIDNIAAVVLATGFEAASTISYLPEACLKTLSVDKDDLNNPFALAFHATHHPSIPNLGFVGFYRSPYWGVMEMQARFLMALWTAGGPHSPSLPPSIATALEKDTSIQRILDLRQSPARMSQFPMGDYAWLMQEFAGALGLEPQPYPDKMPKLPTTGEEMDILTPARYLCKDPTPKQLEYASVNLRETLETATAGVRDGKFVAKAVFRSLQGKWKLERTLNSKLPSHPTGTFTGTAEFLLREGTRHGLECVGGAQDQASREAQSLGLEYLYIEEGDFTAENGMTFRATRRYIWRYDDLADKLSVWFVKTGHDERKKADYLFHEIEFQVPESWKKAEGPETNGQDGGKKSRGWLAKSGHLCIDDYYDVEYEFPFAAVNLKSWTQGYSVKGPKKDYSIFNVYSRP